MFNTHNSIPHTVQAVQVSAENVPTLPDNHSLIYSRFVTNALGVVTANNGVPVVASVGDWIVQDADGELMVLSDAKFQACYGEAV